MERKVGEVFTLEVKEEQVTLKAIELHGCTHCYFDQDGACGDPEIQQGDCSRWERKDGKDVIFVKQN